MVTDFIQCLHLLLDITDPPLLIMTTMQQAQGKLSAGFVLS